MREVERSGGEFIPAGPSGRDPGRTAVLRILIKRRRSGCRASCLHIGQSMVHFGGQDQSVRGRAIWGGVHTFRTFPQRSGEDRRAPNTYQTQAIRVQGIMPAHRAEHGAFWRAESQCERYSDLGGSSYLLGYPAEIRGGPPCSENI